jgi:putative NADH-flavin reductase
MMKILLIGATGMIGSRIRQEAERRGHQVTPVSRNTEDPKARADARRPEEVARLLPGHDAAVVAVSPRAEGSPSIPEVASAVLEAMRGSEARLFMVGGAGSLEVAPGVQLLDTPDFPEAYKPEGLQGREALKRLRASDANWTYLSPAVVIAPGERTGRYRTSGDQLLVDEQGNSFISAEDYAVAVLDELESPRHVKQRFSVAY